MKLLNRFIKIFITLVIVFTLTSCDIGTNTVSRLETPVLTLGEEGWVSWEAIENSVEYSYSINGEEKVSTTELSIQLQVGDFISVMAIAGEGYRNSFWSKTLKYTGLENVVYYTVTFIVDGETVKKVTVEEGKDATDLAPVVTKESDEEYSYEFSGWSKSITNITKDIKVEAIFTKTPLNVVDPTQVSFNLSDNGFLTWVSVEGYSYQAMINDELIDITNQTYFELNDGDRVQMRSIEGEIINDWSEERVVDIKILPTKMEYNYKDYGNNNVYELEYMPSVGDVKVLVVPVWFTDSTTYIEESEKEGIKDDVETAFFGTSEEAGWESVKSYYYKASNGLLNMDGFVTDWWDSGKQATRLTAGDVDWLVYKATDWAKETYDLDYTEYDADGNGYIDCVCLIYGYYDYDSAGIDNDNLWAFCYWLQDESMKDEANPGPNSYFFASYDFIYSIAGNTSYANFDTHTYIHEMGHILGLEDYYDVSGHSNPAGGFSMQDCNVGGHDPYSKIAFGWTDPLEVTEDAYLTIKPFELGGNVILVKNTLTTSPFDEYLLLEFYGPVGLNEFDTLHKLQPGWVQGVNEFGVRIWHVDARLTYILDFEDDFDENNISTTIEEGKYYYHATSNTYPARGYEDYASVLKSFRGYSLLHLIRNDKDASSNESDNLKASDLFMEGDVFTMEDFQGQFYIKGLLDDSTELNVKITIDLLTEEFVNIKIDFE